jgi:NADPH-dependent curcumin reductase CurA
MAARVSKERTSMPAVTSYEVRLASRPQGWPTPDNFSLVRVDVPPPADGEVLVRNRFMSVDPYMRGRMNDVKSYTPPFQIGQPLEGHAVGDVVESRDAAFRAGDVVMSMRGWREHFVAPARDLRAVDPRVQPLSAYLGLLGMPGLTAWVGLNLVDVKAGDRVFVSGAAGAVGSTVGQLAKLRGCFVVGSAGSVEKVKTAVEEFGFDRAFNYKEGDVRGQLDKAAPDGIDVYFDNVGGDHLEAAIHAMRLNGRIIACGAISRYNDEAAAPGPRNLAMVIGKRLTMKGFIVSDWVKEMPEFIKTVGGLYAAGKLRMMETVVEGIDRAPQAFIDLLRGENVGKMVVKVV